MDSPVPFRRPKRWIGCWYLASKAAGGRGSGEGGREREREREEEDLKMPNATNSHSTGSHHRAHTARLRTRLNIKELENNANAPKI